MSTPLFDLDEFTEAWEPVYAPGISVMGWKWMPPCSVPFHEDGTPITSKEWNQYLALRRCRDCGVKVSGDRGGSDNGGWFLCIECGELVDEWFTRTKFTRDELSARRAHRRANYLRRTP